MISSCDKWRRTRVTALMGVNWWAGPPLWNTNHTLNPEWRLFGLLNPDSQLLELRRLLFESAINAGRDDEIVVRVDGHLYVRQIAVGTNTNASRQRIDWQWNKRCLVGERHKF